MREKRERKSEWIYERENPMNKQIIKNFGIDVHTIFNTFRTRHKAWIVVFGVSNAKYLAVDMSDENGLTTSFFSVVFCILYPKKKGW